MLLTASWCANISWKSWWNVTRKDSQLPSPLYQRYSGQSLESPRNGGIDGFFLGKISPFFLLEDFPASHGMTGGLFFGGIPWVGPSGSFRPSGLLCWDVAPGPGDGVPGERTSELATTRMAWTLEGALFRSILTVRSLRRPGVDVVSLRWALNFVDFLDIPWYPNTNGSLMIFVHVWVKCVYGCCTSPVGWFIVGWDGWTSCHHATGAESSIRHRLGELYHVPPQLVKPYRSNHLNSLR